MKVTPYHASQRLDEQSLTPELLACPACGFDGERPAECTLQPAPEVVLRRCPRCAACSASRMPTEAALDAYYGGYYDEQQAERVTFARLDRFARRLVDAVDLAALPSAVRLLDLGGGDGSLALRVAKLLDRPVEIVVVDYADPRSSDDPRVSVRGAAALADVQGEFHVVIASAIVEHIPRLRETLLELFDRLAPGGWFYARTPWMTPLAKVIPGLDLTFPAHVHDLGATFWARLPQTLDLPLIHRRSRPSIVETSFRQHPARTAAAWLLKLPASMQAALASPRTITPVWRLVGGWEVVMQRAPGPGAP